MHDATKLNGNRNEINGKVPRPKVPPLTLDLARPYHLVLLAQT